MKGILDLEDDGEAVLFDDDDEDKTVISVSGKKLNPTPEPKKPEDFGLLEQLTSKGEDDFATILEALQEFASPHFGILVNRETDTIQFVRVTQNDIEENLTDADKLDLIMQTTHRLMQELDELRQHVFTIEKKVTQRSLLSNLLSNMKQFILGK